MDFPGVAMVDWAEFATQLRERRRRAELERAQAAHDAGDPLPLIVWQLVEEWSR